MVLVNRIQLFVLLVFYLFSMPVFSNPSECPQISQSKDYDGRIISSIRLNKKEIFDNNDPKENKKIHQLANRLHSPTKDKVILKLINVKKGDVYRQSVIDDAERTLRATGYLINNSIQPFIQCDGTLELVVTTKDVWSIIPIFTFSDQDGRTIYNFNLQNINFFGKGQNLTVGLQSEDSNNVFRASYRVPFLFDTDYQLSTHFASGDELDASSIQIQKPFRSIDSRRSHGWSFSSLESNPDLYLRNESFFSYDLERENYGLFYGWSDGIQRDAVRRWRIGINHLEETFENQRSVFTGISPLEDREWTSLWLTYSRFTDEFIKINNFRTIHRTEDLFVGRSWAAHMRYAYDRSSGEVDRINAGVNHLNTPFINDRNIFFYRTHINGTWLTNQNRGENIKYGLSAEYYWLPKDNRRLAIVFTREWGRSLTLDQLYVQGGNHNLRGYPENYQLGNERYSFTIEKRFFYDWELWRLLRFATVAYIDTGRSWFTEDSLGALTYTGDKQLTNIGVGLRGVSNRADLYSIGHINIALPLTEVPDLRDDQIGIDLKSIRFSIGVYSEI